MRRKVDISKYGDNIAISMHGNIYKINGWRVYTDSPLKFIKHNHTSAHKELISKNTCQFITNGKRWYMVNTIYNNDLGFTYYILYRLTLIDYNELLDIRKGYLHENIYHP